MSIEDLLDWSDRRMLGGTLTVENARTVRTFGIDAGYLVGVVSSVPGEAPEQVLARAGLIDRPALDRLLARRSRQGAPLVQALRDIADLDQAQAGAVLVQHASELLLDAWVWDEGSFTFETSEELPLAAGLGVSARLRECMVKGRQRAHRWRQIRAAIPDPDVPLAIADRMRLAADSDAEDVLEEILELTRGIESGLSIEQLVEQWHGWRFRVYDRLALLIERGGVTMGRAATPAHGAPADDDLDSAASLLRAARMHADASRAGKALELVERALRLEPGDVSLQKYQRELERTVFAELSRDLLTSFRVPKLMVGRQELDSLDLSDTERYLAGRVDGRWDLLSLMRVAPVREVEALITFKRLADRGIISL